MNPLFKQIYDQVVVNTNRPNLKQEIRQDIKSATLEFHQRGRFIRDVRQAVLTSTNGGQLRYNFNIPAANRLRQILAIQPVRSDGLLGKRLPEMDLFSPSGCGAFGYSWDNTSLKIVVPHAANSFNLSYLEFPDLTEDGYNSWIAKIYPHFIVASATVKTLVKAGMADQAGYYNNLVGSAATPGSYVQTLLRECAEVDHHAT